MLAVSEPSSLIYHLVLEVCITLMNKMKQALLDHPSNKSC